MPGGCITIALKMVIGRPGCESFGHRFWFVWSFLKSSVFQRTTSANLNRKMIGGVALEKQRAGKNVQHKFSKRLPFHNIVFYTRKYRCIFCPYIIRLNLLRIISRVCINFFLTQFSRVIISWHQQSSFFRLNPQRDDALTFSPAGIFSIFLLLLLVWALFALDGILRCCFCWTTPRGCYSGVCFTGEGC